jgi:hypothetical protein
MVSTESAIPLIIRLRVENPHAACLVRPIGAFWSQHDSIPSARAVTRMTSVPNAWHSRGGRQGSARKSCVPFHARVESATHSRRLVIGRAGERGKYRWLSACQRRANAISGGERI